MCLGVIRLSRPANRQFRRSLFRVDVEPPNPDAIVADKEGTEASWRGPVESRRVAMMEGPMVVAQNSVIRRLAPWSLALGGLGMMALGTLGFRVLLALLAPFGVRLETHGAPLGQAIIWLVGVGLVLFIIGIVLAVARSGALRGAWLIGIGVTLLVLGSGPLLAVGLAAALGFTADPNPNPVFFGMLAAATFIPAVVLLVCGLVVRSRRQVNSVA
jgi:hypothetical protein